ncbi:hypothetical protein BDF22DRAFT_654433 [Syncephalis plumigaleata]|nr:hypothetical protein BDF22DRAFT_654433 [Syncephalis plumigaleata]
MNLLIRVKCMLVEGPVSKAQVLRATRVISVSVQNFSLANGGQGILNGAGSPMGPRSAPEPVPALPSGNSLLNKCQPIESSTNTIIRSRPKTTAVEMTQEQLDNLNTLKQSLQRERLQVAEQLNELQMQAAHLADDKRRLQVRWIDVMARRLMACDKMINQVQTGRAVTHVSDTDRILFDNPERQEARALLRMQAVSLAQAAKAAEQTTTNAGSYASLLKSSTESTQQAATTKSTSTSPPLASSSITEIDMLPKDANNDNNNNNVASIQSPPLPEIPASTAAPSAALPLDNGLKITKEQLSSRYFGQQTSSRTASMDTSDVPYRPPSIMLSPAHTASGRPSNSMPRNNAYTNTDGDTNIPNNNMGCGVSASRPVLNVAMNLLPAETEPLVPLQEDDESQEQPILRVASINWPQSPDDGFYDTQPPLPMIGHPLIATEAADGSGWVRYYQAPKWVIPIADMEDISLVTRRGIKVRECFAIITRERQYVLRGRDRRELACWLFLLKRMVNARRRAELIAATAELEAARALAARAAAATLASHHTRANNEEDETGRPNDTSNQTSHGQIMGYGDTSYSSLADVSTQWRQSVGELLGFDPTARSGIRGSHK